jgi:hypothetical protein
MPGGDGNELLLRVIRPVNTLIFCDLFMPTCALQLTILKASVLSSIRPLLILKGQALC